ncbi:carbonic anhydrase 1 [Scaptodrosophila lebanonensis]|uniref:Carbonic anhydrase 1 n=1 Tax=Drosophila lebanonensis TaxID=7225 RepID=A0A6J2UMC2_DROLE|nr:carbonic anhydrase 1 [Scaptodrosophila lebanonensis]
MFTTTIGTLVSSLVQCLWLLCCHAWSHPLLSTGVCVLVALICQNNVKVRQLRLSQLYERLCTALPWNRSTRSIYGYNFSLGPHTWNCRPAVYQSPVNIDERLVQKLAIRELLNWNHYDDLPESIVLENTGNTLVLRAQFRGNAPTISGADLLASYTFVELRFHWGWCNSEGSEHTLNHKKFPLEMQVMHRAGAGVPRACTSSYDLLMIAYIFELSAHNPFLDPLIQNLKLVQVPNKKVRIAPFPLSYLIYAFRTGFYSYGGSLTEPPCYQGTEWFVFPESLAISDFQLRHFRQLLSADRVTPITRNSRPVQQLGSRVINLNYFCPYNSAQLARLRSELCDQQEEGEATTEAVAYEEEGQLVETLDTTTIITTSSNTSICATTLKRSDADTDGHSNKNGQPHGIVIISSSHNSIGGSGSCNNTGPDSFNNSPSSNNIGVCCNNNKRSCCGPLLEQTEEIPLSITPNTDCDAMCGVGDGVGVGVRIELIE